MDVPTLKVHAFGCMPFLNVSQRDPLRAWLTLLDLMWVRTSYALAMNAESPVASD